MLLKKILSVSIIASLIMTSFLMITQKEENEALILKIEENQNIRDKSTNYTNHVEFNNDVLQLKKEAVQFKITFHQNDSVDVSLKIVTMYVDETITCVYCLLTDGAQSLLEPRCIAFIPERRFLLLTPKIRLSIGKWWLPNIFPDTVGQPNNASKQFDVQAGDTWYLTLAVPTTSEKSYFSVVFESTNGSMEVTQLARHRNVGFYTPTFKQFSGKYYAIKLGILGGGSACDISKEITIRNGSTLQCVVAGHRKGTMTVYPPSGEKIQLDEKGMIRYIFLGNVTGTWKFAVKGWSLYFRMVVFLFYIDIDPHVRTI